MKRFIALVLSLVMALSLCVPAWGAESKPVEVDNADDLVTALGEGNDVIMTDDITIDPASLSSGYGTTGIVIKNGQTFDGGNNTLVIKNADNTWDSGIATSGGVIKNLTVYGSFRGIFVLGNDKKAVLENVTVGGDGTVYTVHCDSGKGAGLEATNCTFNGWTSFAKTLGSAVFTNCTFGQGSGYAFCRPYAPTTFVGCTFEEGFELGAQAEVFFDNCTLGGEPLTAENLATFVIENPNNAKVLGSAADSETKVEVDVAAPDVDVNETLAGDDKAAADVIATGGVTINETELKNAAEVVAANTNVTETDAVKALQANGLSAANAAVVVEPYFEVVVEDVDVANGTIALDITPMYQVFATNGTDKAEIGEPQDMDIPEGKSVEIKVQIPDALAAKGKLYVAHDGSELYEATVTGTTGAFFATFTTTSGFSPYVFYTDLKALLDAAASGTNKTVTLMGNVELPEQLTLPEGVTLDGNGYTISVAGDTWSTVNGYKNLVLLNKNTTLKNVTLDSENLAYGVQAYCVTGVKLENVSIINSKGAGLTVNGATVDAVNLKASGNAWGSVNVDPGSGVTSESKFTVSGNNTKLSDATSIWSDGDNVTAGTNDVEVAISGGTYAGDINVPAAAGDVEITGGTFATDVSDYLDNDVFQDANGGIVALPTGHIPSGGATLAPSFEVRGETQYKYWDAKVTAKKGEDAKDKEFATYTIEMIAKADNAPIWWASGVEEKGEDVDFVWSGEKTFVKVVDAAHADFVVVDGKTITYFGVADAVNTVGWEGKAVKVELPVYPLDNADVKCNTLYADDATTTTYYFYDKVLYRSFDVDNDDADDMVILNVGGSVFFGIATKADGNDGYSYNGHTLQYTTSNVTHNTGLATVTKVYCEDCLATFKFVQAPQTVANGVFGDDNYQRVEDNARSPYYDLLWMEKVNPAIPGVSSAIGGNYVIVGGSSSGNSSTGKVESAPTFDAGIGLYVGMSIMAAAGSVVVLKKRED